MVKDKDWLTLRVGDSLYSDTVTFRIDNMHGQGFRASGTDQDGDKNTIWFRAGEVGFADFCRVHGLTLAAEVDEFIDAAKADIKAGGPGEVRVTDPNTGGQKGRKQCQIGAVDPLALLAVGRVAGFGGEKYARYNFARGYDWSLSFDAMQRHLLAFWSGEDIDDESGEPHLAHAGWHCLALMTFSMRDRGTDDRMHRYLEGLDQ